MSGARDWKKITGFVLQVVVGGMMILSGAMKLGTLPTEMEAELAKKGSGLVPNIKLIGVGEIASAVLMIVPVTASLGTLLTSGFWGGAICLHLSHNEPYLFQSALLLVTWVGAFLRMPYMFGSFSPSLIKET